MPLTPLPKDKLTDMKLLPQGTYDFEVVKAVEGLTKEKQAPMVTLDLRVFKPDGSGAIFVKDWLIDMEVYACQHKIAAFCEATGATEVGEACIGLSGQVILGVEDNPQYGPQNKVLGYKLPGASKAAPKREQAAPAAAVEEDDSIPF